MINEEKERWAKVERQVSEVARQAPNIRGKITRNAAKQKTTKREDKRTEEQQEWHTTAVHSSPTNNTKVAVFYQPIPPTHTP